MVVKFHTFGIVYDEMAWYGMAWQDILWHGMVWHCMASHCMVWHGMIWSCQAWSDIAWGCNAWYGVAWPGMVWYGMIWEGHTMPCHNNTYFLSHPGSHPPPGNLEEAALGGREKNRKENKEKSRGTPNKDECIPARHFDERT